MESAVNLAWQGDSWAALSMAHTVITPDISSKSQNFVQVLPNSFSDEYLAGHVPKCIEAF
jgi:hypothetical protein